MISTCVNESSSVSISSVFRLKNVQQNTSHTMVESRITCTDEWMDGWVVVVSIRYIYILGQPGSAVMRYLHSVTDALDVGEARSEPEQHN